jgi:hypothetical protein
MPKAQTCIGYWKPSVSMRAGRARTDLAVYRVSTEFAQKSNLSDYGH